MIKSVVKKLTTIGANVICSVSGMSCLPIVSDSGQRHYLPIVLPGSLYRRT